MSSLFERWLQREKRMVRMVADFSRRLYAKMDEDDTLFLASGLAFNVICCLVPILLLFFYVLGHAFQSQEATSFIDQILKTAFPNQPHAIAIRKEISALLSEVVANPKSFGALGLVILLAVSTSLFSSMRSVLHRVFEVKSKIHFVISYLFDLSLVLGLTLLILFTMSLSWLYRGIMKFQDHFPPELVGWHGLIGMLADFSSVALIALYCYLIYRFVPVKRTPRKTALIAAITTSLIWEVSGRVFALYLTSLASYSRYYGTYAFIVVLMIWIFYSCLIFVVGAEIGNVVQKREEEKLSPTNS
jgi:membrane protein